MENKVCGNCGSTYLISDRSLGGKIICTKCGSSFIKNKSVIGKRNNKLLFLLLLISALFLVLYFR